MPDLRSGTYRRSEPLKAIPLENLVAVAEGSQAVRRRDLATGERVIVFTRNSVYSLTARDDGAFDVSGGWFQRKGIEKTTLQVAGCTAGGHALFTEHIAAPGLFMEFANTLRTTRIRAVQRIPKPTAAC